MGTENPKTGWELGIGNWAVDKENARRRSDGLFAPKNNPGSDLLSHAVTHAVPSAVASLTSVFGMGTGVTLLL